MFRQLETTQLGIEEGAGNQAAQPLVTVIVGAYNHERYVEECLESIISGHYRNIQLVIVNDASTDTTGAVVKEWIRSNPDLPVKFINHEVNIGFPASLNEAIREANGDFICIIAADDRMLPNGINDRVGYLLEHPEKLAVFADCRVIDGDGNPVRDSSFDGIWEIGTGRSTRFNDELTKFNVVFHWATPGPAFLCRTKTYQTVGPYDEHYSFVEDYDMYLRLIAAGGLGFVYVPVADYRRHQRNVSVLNWDPMVAECADMALKNWRSVGGLCGVYLLGRFCREKVGDHTHPVPRLTWLVTSKALRAIASWAYKVKLTWILWHCERHKEARIRCW